MYWLGLFAALIGNGIIGIGQCVQKYALNSLPYIPLKSSNGHHSVPQKASRFTSKHWFLGLCMAYLGEMGNVIGLSFVSASIITPLGIISVLSNAACASTLLGEHIPVKNRFGYIWIVGGVMLILLTVPRPPVDFMFSTVLTKSDWMLFMTNSWFLPISVLCCATGIYLIYSIMVQSKDTIFNFITAGSMFGAVAVLSQKSVAHYVRLSYNSDSVAFNAANASSIANSKSTVATGDQASSFALIVLCSTIAGAVVVQELMKQQALSRFAVSKIQPLYYAAYNVICVLSNAIVYHEVVGGFFSWLKFSLAFLCGLALIVRGSFILQDKVMKG